MEPQRAHQKHIVIRERMLTDSRPMVMMSHKSEAIPMIGSGELFLILCIMLLLFGGKKLPELARSLGGGLREFKKACQEESDDKPNKPE